MATESSSDNAADPAVRHLLNRFCVVHTRDPEEMCHSLLTVYGARSVDMSPGEAPFEGRGHYVALANVDFSYCCYTAKVHLEFAESRHVRQQICINGHAETRFGRTHVALSPHDSCIIPANTEIRSDFLEDYQTLVLRFDINALTNKLSAMLGTRPNGTLVFDPEVDLRNPNNQNLRRMAFLIGRELDAMGPDAPRSVLAELEQTLMVYFLVGNRHNYSPLLEREPAGVAPWQVRRAEEFIAENWSQPITIEALADAVGTSVRSLFKSFRESRGYTPMAFVKSIRLERARAMLMAADAATSVTGAALACGFHNLGHFARDYRDCFGELPSETLKKTR